MSSKSLSPSGIRNFRQSRAGTYLSIGTQVIGAFGIYKRVRQARRDHDNLMLLDAVVSGVALATGVAVLVRGLRRLGEDDEFFG
ncbi:hypothetical protein [Allostreptomyces psammosilenae]|uniref:DUF202 domain-containing protein n=1 Tax=Allostreptomyces psammosilenae TaxID=1892865 RepID=A0A852ZVX4_9ACTN|nr:hypothetical protein [Allostreptomyces psammosilenae]NYI06543.1 hypothetical protein [Allostreptomyces psammosilenae]